jgi:ABC-type multidrug transport system fused ATPase/permease subunit
MTQSSRISRVLQFVVPYWRKLVIIFFLTISATVFGLAYPLFAQVLIDDVLLGGNTKWLLWIALGMFGVTMLGLLFGVLNRYLYTWVSTKILFNMRLAFYQHMQKLSLRFYSKTKVGEIMSRINSDIAVVQGVAMGALLSFVTNVLVLVVSLTFCVWLNWKLFLISSIFIPLAVVALGYFRPRVANQARKMREKNADIASFLVETLSGIKFIKASQTEKLEAERLDQKNTELITSLLRFQILSSFASGIPAIIFALSAMIIFLYGGYQVITGALTLGSLVAFAAYQARFVGPLQNLAGLYMSLQIARVSLERVFEFMDIEPEIKEKENAISLDRVAGRVRFKNVSMGYEGDDRVLKDVSFVIPEGSTFAIIGPSGAGKTTIIDLLLRFYDPQEGSIELDGYDLRDWSLSLLRKNIALVGQEVFLFHATIEENIRYGARDATRDQVIEAAKAAYIHDFIETLPQGYETVVGERGVNLSAGQRQRIAIARTFLADAKILILDEATSSLDWPSETYIRKALESLAEGRTTIIVTHRLPAIKNADRILVLDHGQIVQEGTHHELLAQGGLYRRLYFEGEDKRGKIPSDIGRQWYGNVFRNWQ